MKHLTPACKSSATSCALCRQQRPLQYSHIIPEFQYKPLYDAKHRIHIVSSDPAKPDRTIRKGIREYLLCLDCEQRFSKWESYSSRVLFGDAAKLVRRSGKRVFLQGIDYPKFKLFLMSLLWRMGVASGPIWKEVDLGPHEEKLRLALLSGDPLTANDYSCLLIGVLVDGKFDLGWFLPPQGSRANGHRIYRVIINGVAFVFFVSGHHHPLNLGRIAINEKNEMTLAVEEARNMPFVTEALCSLGIAIRTRDRA